MLKCLKRLIKQKPVFRSRRSVRNRRHQSTVQQGCEEAVHQLHRSSSARKECVMKTATTIQENAEDIYAEAQQINEDRAAKAAQEFDGEVEAEAAETAADAE